MLSANTQCTHLRVMHQAPQEPTKKARSVNPVKPEWRITTRGEPKRGHVHVNNSKCSKLTRMQPAGIKHVSSIQAPSSLNWQEFREPHLNLWNSMNELYAEQADYGPMVKLKFE